MELPKIASREEWLAARLELPAKEKELSRAQAALAAEGQALPMVEITKDYAFSGPDGPARLADLFEGRGQLIIYHFMWLRPIDEGCPSRSFATDNMPDPVHLNQGADTTLALVSRAPFERIERFRERMGWTLPRYSSAAISTSRPAGSPLIDRPFWAVTQAQPEDQQCCPPTRTP